MTAGAPLGRWVRPIFPRRDDKASSPARGRCGTVSPGRSACNCAVAGAVSGAAQARLLSWIDLCSRIDLWHDRRCRLPRGVGAEDTDGAGVVPAATGGSAHADCVGSATGVTSGSATLACAGAARSADRAPRSVDPAKASRSPAASS
jgi:hypothetical protein